MLERSLWELLGVVARRKHVLEAGMLGRVRQGQRRRLGQGWVGDERIGGVVDLVLESEEWMEGQGRGKSRLVGRKVGEHWRRAVSLNLRSVEKDSSRRGVVVPGVLCAVLYRTQVVNYNV